MGIEMTMPEQAVPFVISYRQVVKKPQVERRRIFVGPIQLVKNVLASALEFIEHVAFDTETNVIDPGRSNVVHWAVTIEDPWDNNREATLIAHKTHGDRPPCGAHFEIVSHAETHDNRELRGRARGNGGTKTTSNPLLTRPIDPAYLRQPPYPADNYHNDGSSVSEGLYNPFDDEDYIDD